MVQEKKVLILPAVDSDWLIYSKPIMRIDANQLTVLHWIQVNQDLAINGKIDTALKKSSPTACILDCCKTFQVMFFIGI